MYTAYKDLLVRQSTPNDKIEQFMFVQKTRDRLIRAMMLQEKYKDFPMHENDVVKIIPFFKDISIRNPILNIILVHKIEQEEIGCNVICNGNIRAFSSRKEAYDVIYGENFKIFAVVNLKN
jgi:hypothetical protein